MNLLVANIHSTWILLNSNFFQAIITLLAVVGSAYFGVRSFHLQQKAKRLEKLYFNDSLVAYSNILSENIRISIKNRNCFADVLDCIDNLGSGEDKGNLLERVADKINELETPKSIGLIAGQLNFLFTDSSNHFAQWIAKAQNDFELLHVITKGQLEKFRKLVIDRGSIDRHNDARNVAVESNGGRRKRIHSRNIY